MLALGNEYKAHRWAEVMENRLGGNQEPCLAKHPRGGDRPGWSQVGSHLCGWVNVVLWQPESLNRNDIST